MKLLVILAAGLVACGTASKESADGSVTGVADGLATTTADGAVATAAEGAVTGEADGAVVTVADGPPATLADGPLADGAGGSMADAADGPGTTAGDGSATDLAGEPLTNVALEGKVTASSVWQNDPRFLPENVIDDSSYDDVDARNYWLLPNQTAGWWQVDLGSEFDIRRIKVFNCNNDEANDRGTKDFRLEIRDAKQEVVHAASGVLPFTSLSSPVQPTVPRVMDLEEVVRGRYVKIYIDTWYPTRTDPTWPHPTVGSSDSGNQGGGLNEVQVFATE
jgi:hypothetical protein